MTRDIKLELSCPYPIEYVWKAVADPGLLKKWAFKTEVNLVAGYKFSFKLKPQAGLKGIVDCEVVDVQKPSKFSFVIKENKCPPTTVILTFEGLRNKTTIKLEHSGFKGLRGIFSRSFFSDFWRKAFLIDLDEVLRENFKIIPWREYSV
jgi:uncharacterized protein YndB with AHSA1/START domain